MEPRIAELEAYVEHIRADLQELRIDVRALRRTVDQHFYRVLGAMTGLAGLIAKGFHWF